MVGGAYERLLPEDKHPASKKFAQSIECQNLTTAPGSSACNARPSVSQSQWKCMTKSSASLSTGVLSTLLNHDPIVIAPAFAGAAYQQVEATAVGVFLQLAVWCGFGIAASRIGEDSFHGDGIQWQQAGYTVNYTVFLLAAAVFCRSLSGSPETRKPAV